MSNANRPGFDDCDHDGYTGCTSCGCSECGALVDRETLVPFALPNGRTGYACQECMAVPEAVEEEGSEAQTVRLESDLSIKETGHGWAEKLSAAVGL